MNEQHIILYTIGLILVFSIHLIITYIISIRKYWIHVFLRPAQLLSPIISNGSYNYLSKLYASTTDPYTFVYILIIRIDEN